MNVTPTERQQYHAAIQVYRILHKLSAPYLLDSFHYAVDITSCVARNIHRLFVPRTRVRTTTAKAVSIFVVHKFGTLNFMQQGHWLILNCYINHFLYIYIYIYIYSYVIMCIIAVCCLSEHC